MRLIFGVILMCVFGAAAIAAAPETSALACGDRQGGWFIEIARDKSAVLFHMPADGPQAALLSAGSLPTAPMAMASLDGRLVMVFEPVRTDPDIPSVLRQVREVKATPGPRPPMQFFSAPAPLPPLDGRGRLEAIAVTEDGPVALLGAGRGLDEPRLVEVAGAHWRDVDLPELIDLSRPLRIGALRGELVVVQERPDESATVWIREIRGGGAEPTWKSQDAAPPPTGSRLLEARGQLLALAPDDEGASQLSLFRAGRWFDVATMPPVEGSRRIFPVGEAVAQVTSSEAEPLRFSCTLISPSGDVMFEGPASTSGPVGRRELEILGLLLASLILTIAVFVLRPSGSERESVTLPEGYALADPWKRILATAIDAALAVLIASLIWNVPFRSIVDLSVAVTSESGVWPIVTAAALLALIGTVGEALTGRTPGKWILRSRTVSTTGERPRWGQAAARNVVKALCPPLAAAALGAPGQRSPASFGTYVIAPASAPPVGPDPGGSESDPKDGPRSPRDPGG